MYLSSAWLELSPKRRKRTLQIAAGFTLLFPFVLLWSFI